MGLTDGRGPRGAVNGLVRRGKTLQCREPITARHERYKIPLHALHSVYDPVCVCNIQRTRSSPRLYIYVLKKMHILYIYSSSYT